MTQTQARNTALYHTQTRREQIKVTRTATKCTAMRVAARRARVEKDKLRNAAHELACVPGRALAARGTDATSVPERALSSSGNYSQSCGILKPRALRLSNQSATRLSKCRHARSQLAHQHCNPARQDLTSRTAIPEATPKAA